MLAPIDEATSQFLEHAADDLQQQLPRAGVVEGVSVVQGDRGVWLVARIEISGRHIEVTGHGHSLLDAYADLRPRVAEPTLASAYLGLMEHLDRTGRR